MVIAFVRQAGFDCSSMDRLGCGFFDHFVDASQFFVSQILVMSCFLKLYFIH